MLKMKERLFVVVVRKCHRLAFAFTHLPKMPSGMKLDIHVPKFKLYIGEDVERTEAAQILFRLANVPYESVCCLDRGSMEEMRKSKF